MIYLVTIKDSKSGKVKLELINASRKDDLERIFNKYIKIKNLLEGSSLELVKVETYAEGAKDISLVVNKTNELQKIYQRKVQHKTKLSELLSYYDGLNREDKESLLLSLKTKMELS